MKTILMDMDGVIFDFHGHAHKVHGIKEDKLSWPAGVWEMATVWGMSQEEFWAPLDTEIFWDNVPLCPGAEYFVDLLQYWTGAEIVFASIPSQNPGSYAAKIRALKKHGFLKGKGKRDVILGTRKDLLSGPGTFLIDDSDKNVEAARARGGAAYLFPQPWNMRRDDWAQYHEPSLYGWVLGDIWQWYLTKEWRRREHERS